jgi:hypothetical protein
VVRPFALDSYREEAKLLASTLHAIDSLGVHLYNFPFCNRPVVKFQIEIDEFLPCDFHFPLLYWILSNYNLCFTCERQVHTL